ncbi:aminoglycoside phosphotransferase family protein [Longispora albida]|uniref:aminoglycoside phosphotransferase family protein n=1 Tax=Longispora albida TaxID=203523 RepID=UPI00036915B6|nr:aminoglycoside phosphotransferase family protein [Longispora albida]
MAQTHFLVPEAGAALRKTFREWDRGEHTREWAMLNRAHEHAPGLVPEPLGCDLDADPPWVLMGRLPGAPLPAVPSPAQVTALGDALEELWSVPAADLIPRRSSPGVWPGTTHAGLSAAPRPEGVAGEAYDAALVFLSKVEFPAAPAVLGHCDPNPANYLHDGGRVRIVDFEDAGMSDADYELGTMLEHIAMRDASLSPLVARLARDERRLRDARLTAASFWLLLLLPGGRAARRNPPGTLTSQATRLLSLL